MSMGHSLFIFGDVLHELRDVKFSDAEVVRLLEHRVKRVVQRVRKGTRRIRRAWHLGSRTSPLDKQRSEKRSHSRASSSAGPVGQSGAHTTPEYDMVNPLDSSLTKPDDEPDEDDDGGLTQW